MTTRKAAHGYAMKRWLDLTQPMPRPQVTLDDVVAEYIRMRKAQGHPVGHVAWESIEAKVKELKETARAKPHQQDPGNPQRRLPDHPGVDLPEPAEEMRHG